MALVLLPALRHAGARLHWVWEWRHPAVRHLARLSGWTIGYVATNQVAFWVALFLAYGHQRRRVGLPRRVHVLPAAARAVRGVDHDRARARAREPRAVAATSTGCARSSRWASGSWALVVIPAAAILARARAPDRQRAARLRELHREQRRRDRGDAGVRSRSASSPSPRTSSRCAGSTRCRTRARRSSSTASRTASTSCSRSRSTRCSASQGLALVVVDRVHRRDGRLARGDAAPARPARGSPHRSTRSSRVARRDRGARRRSRGASPPPSATPARAGRSWRRSPPWRSAAPGFLVTLHLLRVRRARPAARRRPAPAPQRRGRARLSPSIASGPGTRPDACNHGGAQRVEGPTPPSRIREAPWGYASSPTARATCPSSGREELGIEIVPLTIRFGAEEYVDRVELTNEEFWTQGRHLRRAAGDRGAVGRRLRGDLPPPRRGGRRRHRLHQPLVPALRHHAVRPARGEGAEGDLPGRGRRLAQRLDGPRAAVHQRGEPRRRAARTSTPIARATEDQALRTRLFGALDTLEHLRRGGRIGAAQALLGGVLSIKPVIEVRDGAVAEAGKVRTHQQRGTS